MKRRIHFVLACVLILSVCFGTGLSASAAAERSEAETAAAFLRDQGIMFGNETGDMMLGSGLSRAQLAAVLSRMIVGEEHLQAEKAFYSRQCTFTDVPEWARVYVGYCAANQLVAGYGNGIYGSSDSVTSAAACTVILRSLEDAGTDWTYQSACAKAVELGLAPAAAVSEREITRGDMAILLYRTMQRLGLTEDDGAFSDNKTESATYVEGVRDIFSGAQPIELHEMNAAKQEMIAQTNTLRRGQKLEPLTVNDMLMEAAQVRAEEMAAASIYSHTRPDGRAFFTVTDCPYVAENIHRIADWQLTDASLADTAIDAWEKSDGHRKNMLNSSLSEIGIGLARGVNGSGDPCWYCVQIFLYDGQTVTWVDEAATTK